MSKLIKYAEYFKMAEFMKAQLEVSQNGSRRGDINFCATFIYIFS